MNSLLFLACSVMLFALVMGGIGFYGTMEEQRIYQEKLEKNRLLRYQRAKEAERKQKDEALEAVK